MTRQELFNKTKQAKLELDKAINENFGYVGSSSTAQVLYDKYAALLEELRNTDLDCYNLFINTYV